MSNTTAPLNNTPVDRKQINDIFLAALDIQKQRRRDYVEEQCRGDQELRAEVEWLLDNYERAGTFLDQPVLQALVLRPLRDASGQTLSEGTVLAGRFTIEQLLGGGGMGQVYRASDKLGDRPVALKVIRPDIAEDPAITALFYQEVNAAKSVAHRNVCRIHDTHTDVSADGVRRAFLTMELINGISLSERLRLRRRISSADLLGLAEQIAEGLSAVHRSGIAHGDFKSANILLESANGEVRCVITDFGLARLTATKHMRSIATGAPVIGTPAYMAPEQFEGVEPETATDIYAFGVVLFEAVTGVQPFRGSPFDIREQKLIGPVPVAKEYLPQLSDRWNRVLQKAMAQRPEDRFQHVEEVVEALRTDTGPLVAIPYVQGSGENSTATDASLQVRPWWRRRRILIPSAALVLTVLGIASEHRPPADATRWFDEGIRAMRQGTYFRAMKAFDEATRIDQNFELAHVRCAEAAYYVEDGSKAKTELLSVTPPFLLRFPTPEHLRLQATYDTINKRWNDAISRYKLLSAISYVTGSAADRSGVLLDIARVYETTGDTSHEEETLKRAATVDPDNPAVALRLGYLYRRIGKVPASEEQLAKAESFFRRANNQDGLTEVLYQRGVLLNKNSRATEAVPFLEQALKSAEDSGNDYRRIKSLLELSNIAYVKGNTKTGRDYAEKAVDLARRVGPDSLAADALIEAGMAILSDKEDRAAAEKYFADGIDAARRADAPRVRARGLLNYSNLLRRQNRFPESVQASREAYAYYSKNHFTVEAASCAFSIAAGLIGQGKLADAELTLQPYISGNVDRGDTGAMIEYEYASILEQREKYADALTAFKTSAGHFKGNELMVAWATASAAQVAARLGKFTEADDLFETAKDTIKMPDQLKRLATVLHMARANVEFLRKNWTEALRSLDALDPKVLDDGTKIEIQIIRCIAATETNKVSREREICADLPTSVSELSASLRSQGLFAAATAQLKLGHPETAATLSKQALDEAIPNDRFETQFKASVLIARSLRDQGQNRQAAISAKLADDALQQQLARLSSDFRSSYLRRPDIESDRISIERIK